MQLQTQVLPVKGLIRRTQLFYQTEEKYLNLEEKHN